MIRLPLLLLLFSPWALGHKEYFGGPQGRVKRQMARLSTKWTNGQVNYEIGPYPREGQTEVLRAGMDYISNRTCIKFVESSTATQRIYVQMGAFGCESPVGAPGTRSSPHGKHDFLFGACSRLISTAVHELLHTLGSIHEHQRSDRDNFLWINQSVINSRGIKSDFMTKDGSLYPNLVPFDHASVLMYDWSRYAQEPGDQIFGAWDPELDYSLGNGRITYFDMWRVNDFYKCWCPKELACANQAETNPGDCTKCWCPMGWFGRLCDQRQPGSIQRTATTQWQTQSITSKWQSTPESAKGHYSTYTYIDAPAGKTIQVKVDKMEGYNCQPGCKIQGIEIKTRIQPNGDKRITSPILCCNNDKQKSLYTKTFEWKQSPLIIDTYSLFSSDPSTVTIRYRYV